METMQWASPCSDAPQAVYKVKMPTLKIRDFKHSKPYPTKISGFKKSNDPRLFPMRIRHISDGRRAGLLAALGAGAPLLARSGAVAIRRRRQGFFHHLTHWNQIFYRIKCRASGNRRCVMSIPQRVVYHCISIYLGFDSCNLKKNIVLESPLDCSVLFTLER